MKNQKFSFFKPLFLCRSTGGGVHFFNRSYDNTARLFLGKELQGVE
jgi:hypothetical protein